MTWGAWRVAKGRKVSISTWFSHIQASEGAQQLWATPLSQQMICPQRSGAPPLLPSKAVLSFREAELQGKKMTFFKVAFYLQHETAACSWRMWCRITILSIKSILKRYKVTWVLRGLAISKSWMPNPHSQGYKLSTAVQAPVWLQRNKPGASQSLSAFWNPQELSFSLHTAVLNPLVFQNLPTDTCRVLSRPNSCSNTSHK